MKRVHALLMVGIATTCFAFYNANSKQFEISKNLEIFANLYKQLNTHYVDDLDPSAFMRIGIEAMLETLDPYTNYISESDIESYRYMSEGKYDGIGARVRKMGDFVTIVEPYEGGPAIEAGLMAGDKILAVDGKDAKGKKTNEVDDILKGFPGTEVTLTIMRPGTEGELDIILKRDEVTVNNVPYSGMITDDIGYVVLTTFTANAGRNVASAISDLRKENPDMKGLVFDLRNNGGGYLREAVSISNLFIAKDEVVVTTRGKVRERDRPFKTMNDPLLPDLPLVILTNESTASASEIVSGVVQDLDRGVIIGQRTYGKGLVQNTVDLDYNAKLKLTTSKYYIPSGRCIQSVSYKDGEPVGVEDEKRTAFKTRGGRKVLDGGGISPDVKIEDGVQSAVVDFLLTNHLIFHYATRFRQENTEIAPAATYKFTDFDGFMDYVKEENLEFETKTEQALDKLTEASEGERLTDLTKARIEEMQKLIDEEKADDLIEYRDDISALLEKEIVSRYYYQTGKIEKSLRNDKEIEKAITLLSNPAEYQQILTK